MTVSVCNLRLPIHHVVLNAGHKVFSLNLKLKSPNERLYYIEHDATNVLTEFHARDDGKMTQDS